MSGEEIPLPRNPCDSGPFFLGDRLVEPALNRISHGEEAVQVEPRIMHVMTCLAGRAGKVVSRAELLDTVWTRVLVNEEALTHAISQLRKVLDDDPRSPRFIQTIHKTGYRLIAPVRLKTSSRDAAQESNGGEELRGKHRGFFTRRVWVILGGSAVVITVIATMAILSGLRSSIPPAPVPLENIPLTSYAGREICPAISPDGSRVIFSWKEDDEGNYDLFMKQQNTETPLRLTETAGNEYYAAWSPDGTEFAYALYSEDEGGVYIMPALGGAPRKAADTPLGTAGIDWSPDGRFLAYSSRAGQGEPLRIFLYSLATGESRALTSPVKSSGGDYYPAFSPDATRLAFVRADRINLKDIFIVPVALHPFPAPYRRARLDAHREGFGLFLGPDKGGRLETLAAFAQGWFSDVAPNDHPEARAPLGRIPGWGSGIRGAFGRFQYPQDHCGRRGRRNHPHYRINPPRLRPPVFARGQLYMLHIHAHRESTGLGLRQGRGRPPATHSLQGCAHREPMLVL